MPDILLATSNARYHHTSLGLRCLLANLGSLEPRSEILEFTQALEPREAAAQILDRNPRILGLGVYIWNVDYLTRVLSVIKAVHPELPVVLGGPEVGIDPHGLEIVSLADHVILGEGELVFAQLCRDLLTGRSPGPRFIGPVPPDLSDLSLPDRLYSDRDIRERSIYVEASRGCPFTCRFCTSSISGGVRSFPQDQVLASLDRLWNRGVRSFKFIDRSLHLSQARWLLPFFLERVDPDLFLHFEVMPDMIGPDLLKLLAPFPPGAIQLEVGIQTFSADTCSIIGRRQDPDRAEAGIRALVKTGAHVHGDLILGLPGEGEEKIRTSFNRLAGTGCSEIQLVPLKLLRGTGLGELAQPYGMVFQREAPYEILRTAELSFARLQTLGHLADYYNHTINSGNFKVFAGSLLQAEDPFRLFLAFTDFAWSRLGATHGISIQRLGDVVFDFLVQHLGLPKSATADAMMQEFTENGHRRLPTQVKTFMTLSPKDIVRRRSGLPPRQARHQKIMSPANEEIR